jgi:hypothetical protein
MKARLKKVWTWLRKNVLNKEMIVFVLIAEIIFWSPCIVTGILALIFSPWWWTVFGAICAFWAGPFTPAVPLQIALAVALKKIWQKIQERRKMRGGENGRSETEKRIESDRAACLPQGDSRGGNCEQCGGGENQ